MDRLNNFYEELNSNKKITIGQTFMISSNEIWKWAKTYDSDNNTYYYEYDYIDDSDVLFVIKYIGNGYVQEMVSGETMLLTRIDKKLLEDDSEELQTAQSDGLFTLSRIEDYEPLGYEPITMPEYISELEAYKKLTKKSPLICDLNGGECLFKIDDISKTEYLKHSDEERMALMKKYKEEALMSLKETIKDVDSTIQAYSSISPETLDMAYLENKVYDFQNEGKKTL